MTLSYTDIETQNRHGQRDRSRFAERKAADIDRRNQRQAAQRVGVLIMIIPATHEYAGFLYVIDGTPSRLIATPYANQHKAAWKEKHRRAAVETFLQDHGRS